MSREGAVNAQLFVDDAQRVQACIAELVERIGRAITEDGSVEPLKGIRLNRVSSPTELAHGVSDPAFCVIAQGSKEVFLGNDRYQYDSMHYLLATAELVSVKVSTPTNFLFPMR